VFFERVRVPGGYSAGVDSLGSRVGVGEVLEGEPVLVKPNQLTKTERGVTTNPGVLKAVLDYVSRFSGDVVIGESDTSGRSFEYATSGLSGLDYPLVNLSESETVEVESEHSVLELPVEAVERRVVDIPVLKSHALTGVTGAVKNLFGLLPVESKESLHHRIDGVLCDIYRAVSPEVCFLDGTYVLRNRGPRKGEAVQGGFMAASRDALAMDVAACRGLGVDVGSVPHLSHMAGDSGVEMVGREPSVELSPPEPGWKQRVFSQVQRFGAARRVLRMIDDVVPRPF